MLNNLESKKATPNGSDFKDITVIVPIVNKLVNLEREIKRGESLFENLQQIPNKLH